jgi:mono/diheme cytochrome c family protein
MPASILQVRLLSTRSHVKRLLLTLAIACSLLKLTTALAQNPPVDPSLLANSIYEKNCAKCHGKTAEGRHFGGPSLTSTKTAAASAEDLRTIIANGKGHMPKFAGKLTPEEIATLAAQIQALNKK